MLDARCCGCYIIALSKRRHGGMVVSRFGMILLVFWAMTVLSGTRAWASEAQAALMGGSAGQRYVIPAKLSAEELVRAMRVLGVERLKCFSCSKE